MLITTFIKILLLPPALQVLLMAVSVITRPLFKRFSAWCFWSGLISLWLLSLPVVSASLYEWLESPYQRVSEAHLEGVEAIVVLGAGRHYDAREYQGDTLSHSALWRLRYGAYLSGRYQLPVIVSGGNVRPFDQVAEASLGANFLRNELNVSTVWMEDQSRNTWENAQFTKQLLEEKGITKVALVTHAYHMRRSAYSFERANIDFVPMPTGREANQADNQWWGDGLPQAGALHRSSTALHECMGLLFYWLK